MAGQRLNVTVRVNSAGIERLMNRPSSPVNAFLLRLGNRVLNNSRARVNVDTGYLRSTGTMGLMAGGGVRVSYRASYAVMVHNGTAPHTIRPRRVKLLQFKVGGRTVYARAVQHPGYKGNPYLADALREELNRL